MKLNSSTHTFTQFYREHYRKCFLFAKSYVHDDWVAEDITSEGLIKLWELLKLKPIDHPLSLLFTIIKNKSLDYLKHEMIRQEVLSVLSKDEQRELAIRISTLEACDPERMYSEDVQHIIDETLGALPEQTRKIFLMSRFENLTRQEIADSLGLTKKSVEYNISVAIKKLQISLKDYLPVFYLLLCHK